MEIANRVAGRNEQTRREVQTDMNHKYVVIIHYILLVNLLKHNNIDY